MSVELVLGPVALAAVGALVGFDAKVNGSVMRREIVGSLEDPLAKAADVSGSVRHVTLVHVSLVRLGRLELGAAYFALLQRDTTAASCGRFAVIGGRTTSSVGRRWLWRGLRLFAYQDSASLIAVPVGGSSSNGDGCRRRRRCWCARAHPTYCCRGC